MVPAQEQPWGHTGWGGTAGWAGLARGTRLAACANPNPDLGKGIWTAVPQLRAELTSISHY